MWRECVSEGPDQVSASRKTSLKKTCELIFEEEIGIAQANTVKEEV